MKLFVSLGSLPELQRLDVGWRRHALLDWQIELWRSWSFYFCEISIWLGSFIFFDGHWHLAGQTWNLVSLPTIVSFFIACVLRNKLLYLLRRDVLRRILERPEYAAKMHPTASKS
jgi:hypothetical protein